MSSLERLRDLLRAEGGLMASLLSKPPGRSAGPDTERGPAQIAAAGPRADGHREDYEIVVEAIYEGYLLHYETPRVVDPREDDLRLLAGDWLYAAGLARLVSLGDVDAVAELSDVITLSALAQGSGRRDLAQLIWLAGARAVGWESSPEYARAKDLAFAKDPRALEAMRTSCGS